MEASGCNTWASAETEIRVTNGKTTEVEEKERRKWRAWVFAGCVSTRRMTEVGGWYCALEVSRRF